MARAHYVKSARKDNPVAKKGESYYWWKPMVGGRGSFKRFSKERPSRSQLTQSEFLGALYAIEDDQLAKAETPEDLTAVAEALRELGEEEQGKFDNMPQGLQDGDTGQQIQERAENCNSWADEIDSVVSDWEQKKTEIEELVGSWDDYDNAMSEYDEEDEDAVEPEEPNEERPSEDWESDLASEMRDDASGRSPF
jgi:hypothetical protein